MESVIFALLIVFFIVSAAIIMALCLYYGINEPKVSYLVAWRFLGKEDSRHITCVKARCAADAWKKVKRKATLQGSWEAELLGIRRFEEGGF